MDGCAVPPRHRKNAAARQRQPSAAFSYSMKAVKLSKPTKQRCHAAQTTPDCSVQMARTRTLLQPATVAIAFLLLTASLEAAAAEVQGAASLWARALQMERSAPMLANTGARKLLGTTLPTPNDDGVTPICSWQEGVGCNPSFLNWQHYSGTPTSPLVRCCTAAHCMCQTHAYCPARRSYRLSTRPPACTPAGRS